MHFFRIFICCISLSLAAIAQTHLPVPVNFSKAYHSETRSANGLPGKNYWQNNASYRIAINFDPAAPAISGNVYIAYHNNSLDTLKQLVFKLYPNLYQQQAMRNVAIHPGDLTNGVDIKSLEIWGKTYSQQQLITRGTNLYVRDVRILPGETAHVNIRYSYPVNKGSFTRTGRVDDGAYMIAYFFPRIAVYDDIDGWNEYPYAGKEEFYNDYCNFEAAITLPGNYAVWATGELQNPADVYTPEITERLNAAMHRSHVTDIIKANELKDGRVTTGKPLLTWHFSAKNVTDFAFAASNHYIWKAAGVIVDPSNGRRARADAVYNPLHTAFEPVIGYTCKTLELISSKIPGIPFPYSHETIFEGLDAMEYPMMVNNLPFEGTDAVEFTAHEVFHTIFPFWVGTNETKYSFMDEGWATYAEFTMLKHIAPEATDTYDLSSFNESAGTEQDVPVITLTPQLYGKARFANKDLKPALALHYLREMLGDPVFYKAVRYFINHWQGKHPTPYDFFACMNEGAGRNLDWFWQNWYFEKNVPDLAIDKVEQVANGYNVHIARKGKCMLPIHLQVSYADGTLQEIVETAACWEQGAATVTLHIPANKIITALHLGNAYDADADTSNNYWHKTF